MARHYKPEEIIGKLREAVIVLAQGVTVADACRRIDVTEQATIGGASNMGSEDGSCAAVEGSRA